MQDVICSVKDKQCMYKEKCDRSGSKWENLYKDRLVKSSQQVISYMEWQIVDEETIRMHGQICNSKSH